MIAGRIPFRDFSQNGRNGGRPTIPVTEIAKAFALKTAVPSGNDGDTEPKFTIRNYGTEWFIYSKNRWKPLSKADLEKKVAGFMQGFEDAGKVSRAAIDDVIVNLAADTLCGLSLDIYKMPCMLPDGSDAGGYMSFTNGFVDVSKLCTTANAEIPLIPPTPNLFTLKAVDYPYDPKADCPTWKKIVSQAFPDKEMQRAMQMLFGYILTYRAALNVGFFWIGRGGEGKSVFAHILRSLVGEDNSCAIPFSDLCEKFKTVPLTEVALNLYEEAEVVRDTRLHIADCEKKFKLVTDGAMIDVEKKFQQATKARVTARCVFVANELPAFSDHTNGLWDRIVIFPFTVRFRGSSEENNRLKHELESELPGIFNWAIEGARQLEGKQRFPLTPAMQEEVDKHRLSCDHEAEFLQDYVFEAAATEHIAKVVLYEHYRKWVAQCGYMPVGINKFNNAVKLHFRNVREERVRTPADMLVWAGIRYNGSML